MKLLFDQNLSFRLVELLTEKYPESKHIKTLSMERSSDRDIWEYALKHNFVIVTRDSDFHEWVTLLGYPPKVIWLKCGNCPTERIFGLLSKNFERIQTFESDSELGFLEVY